MFASSFPVLSVCCEIMKAFGSNLRDILGLVVGFGEYNVCVRCEGHRDRRISPAEHYHTNNDAR